MTDETVASHMSLGALGSQRWVYKLASEEKPTM